MALGSTLSLTSAIDGVAGQRHFPAALSPGKTRYPLYRRLGGPQDRSGRVRKISPPTGIRSPDRLGRSESLYRLSCPILSPLLLPTEQNKCIQAKIINYHAVHAYSPSEVRGNATITPR